MPTFSGEFILDDNSLIKNNQYIKETHSITSYLSQEDGISDRREIADYHTGYYRPLINLSYWIDYKLWGMNAPGFRLTNFILHCVSCFLLFQICILLINDRYSSFWSTIIFALHPVNTESVSFIVSRNNILATLFALSSFYFYIKAVREPSYTSLILSAILFSGAVFSKEFGVMVLPIFFLYHRFLSEKRGSILHEFATYIPFILVLLSYFILRNIVTNALLTPFDIGHVWSRIYYSPYLIILNLKLIFFPYGLHQLFITYPHFFLTWQAIVSIALVFLIGIALWIERNNKFILFSGLSFLAFLFPVLNIIPTAATPVTLVALRWLYPSITFILLGLAWIIQKAIARRRMLTTSLLCIAVCYFGTYSYFLNKNLWHDEGTFYNQEVRNFNNYLYAGGLAERLLDSRKYKEAEKYFQIAIEQYPDKAKNYINYSALLIETQRPDDALIYLNKAKEFCMYYSERGQLFNNMGMAYFNLRKNNDALKSYKKAVIFNPNEPQFWANLGGAYGLAGDYEDSVVALRKGISIAPNSIPLRKNLAVTYILMENYEKAILVLEQIPAPEIERNREIQRLLQQAHKMLLMKAS
jgi:tetratricopeptide (TPR) repeat protein